ncbi:glycosyltransferase [Sphingobacterium paludis]|uniref:Glycosyltransferase involved in cell wall biosynthesis n=1 Tax=Sphingobacterium paludis TaxID=1476465 RepID=A0A4R7D4K3_9SPHI|nr:glycosyltransferase [Sphingobacterium paludis]TDS13796.1 glycosyltransferase involved in cell wall biosynthesis [Sphingobacterium paludis]
MAQKNELHHRKTIVISAVNLNRGGTLRILRDCLNYLSILAEHEDYRILAIVYKKELVDFPNIEYIETQWPKKRWVNRLWYEYVSLRNLSKSLQPVALWFSLHDTTPSVVATRRAVYCHNSFPFLKWNLRDVLFAPKIVLFALFSRFIYQFNIQKNNYVVVQQEWFRDAFVRLFNLNAKQIIVAPANGTKLHLDVVTRQATPDKVVFIYPAIADSHKNFECICAAAECLWAKGVRNFEVLLTISGEENTYTKWLFNRWAKKTPALRFLGYLDRATLFQHYQASDCLIFSSKVETWGLPISEFSQYGRPLLLADLPYAHETAKGNNEVAFFGIDDHQVLASYMEKLIAGDKSFLKPVPDTPLQEPVVQSWEELFMKLLER